MKIFSFLIISFMPIVSMAQLQSNNKKEGCVISNDITVKDSKIYVCGSFTGEVIICGNKAKGKAFNSPFISISNKDGSACKLIFPLKAHSGYAEFKYIYSFNNSIYVSGVFTKSIKINGDSIEAKRIWDGFILKLDNNDSVEWFKIFNSINSNSAPEISYFNDKLYAGINVGKKDSIQSIVYELNTDGSINWQKTFNNSPKHVFAGLKANGDTISVYLMSNNKLIKTNLLKGIQTESESDYNISGYNLCNQAKTSPAFWVNNELSGNYYECNIFRLHSTLNSINFFHSDYIGNVDLIHSDDSFIYLAGFFQGHLYHDSATYSETDSSNSFFAKYNYKTNNTSEFILLPYKNVFKAKLFDSSIYFISNYVDGGGKIKRSESNSELTINDFKINSIPLIKIKRKSLDEKSLQLINLSAYPNLNSGISINICCDNKIKVLYLTNSVGIIIPFNAKTISNILTVEPVEKLNTGIYFITVINHNNIEQTLKIIVN